MFNTKEIPAKDLMLDLLRDPERKSLFRIVSEVLSLGVKFRRFPRHYFSRYLFKEGRDNISDYFPDPFLNRIKPLFNDREVRDVVENKLYFNIFYSQFGLCLPKILMYNHKNIFVVDNEVVKVNNISDFISLLTRIHSFSSTSTLFVKKTFWSYGGDQIYKISPATIEEDPEFLASLYQNILKSGFLFQETVKQHPVMNQLNPSCLNTIRLDTFIDKDGNVEIISAFIRTSINNSFVDNISSGGCQISIDLDTGRLNKTGFLRLKVYGAKLLTEHPLTKVVFKDFKIPFFDEVKRIVIKAAELMPCLRLVGWDVGIGEDGPVLIEGNSDYDMSGNDLSDGGYRSNAVFRKVLEEINYL